MHAPSAKKTLIVSSHWPSSRTTQRAGFPGHISRGRQFQAAPPPPGPRSQVLTKTGIFDPSCKPRRPLQADTTPKRFISHTARFQAIAPPIAHPRSGTSALPGKHCKPRRPSQAVATLSMHQELIITAGSSQRPQPGRCNKRSWLMLQSTKCFKPVDPARSMQLD